MSDRKIRLAPGVTAPPPNAWAPFHHAPFLCTYGPSGHGKDADMLKAFPDAYIFSFQGSHDSWSTWGPEMAIHPQADLGAMFAAKGLTPSLRTTGMVLSAIHRGKVPWRPAIILSDVSMMADNDLPEIEAEVGDNWTKWRLLLDRVRDVRNKARALNIAVLVNGHDKSEKEEPGHPDHVKGGMKLGSHNARAEFHKMTDLNLRIVDFPDNILWPYGYDPGPDLHWFVKDRWNMIRPGGAPMNLREALLAAYPALPLPRRKGLEWVDKAADEVVRRVRAGETALDAAVAVEDELIAKSKSPGTAYMAAYDGYCRAFYAGPGRGRAAAAAARARAMVATTDPFNTDAPSGD